MTTPYADPQGVHNPATGNSPPAIWGDTVRDDIVTLATPPGCWVNRTATQSAANVTFTYIAFSAADTRDTDTYHDIFTNNTQMKVPTGFGGIYRLTATVDWDINATGSRLIGWRLNGSTITWGSTTSGVATIGTRSHFSDEIRLTAGQYVEIVCYQASGGALDITLARAQLTWLGVS